MKQTAASTFAWAWQIVLFTSMIIAAWVAAGFVFRLLYEFFMIGWRAV